MMTISPYVAIPVCSLKIGRCNKPAILNSNVQIQKMVSGGTGLMLENDASINGVQLAN